ncbi:hypothetical protein PMZ66_16095 [Clostridium paraputrificum]|uniref:hypothetical protein n=1 Tax=Clostridium paraputrificum TaxID=29363 RepID=UPI002330FB11|nr:hypothetical protein [Clostridium paraputrificum]MDB2077139.1 hypothetical protein [Clostridium paraputrificum]MDB2077371.1 hypothetical protein [Clostridium paraputrificum]
MSDNIIKSFNKINYKESEIQKYINLSEEEEEKYKRISGAVKSKFIINNLKNISSGIEKELEDDEKIEKIIKVRNITAIYATTAASVAGGTLGGSLQYGVFDDLFFTNKRIFFVDTNVINEELKHKFVRLDDVLGILFTNKIVKVKEDENGFPKLVIKMNKVKIAAIIWSIIAIIGFFITRKLRIEFLGILFTISGLGTIIYSILKSIQDVTYEKFQIVLKDGFILKGLIGNDDYDECINYLKMLNKND